MGSIAIPSGSGGSTFSDFHNGTITTQSSSSIDIDIDCSGYSYGAFTFQRANENNLTTIIVDFKHNIYKINNTGSTYSITNITVSNNHLRFTMGRNTSRTHPYILWN